MDVFLSTQMSLQLTEFKKSIFNTFCYVLKFYYWVLRNFVLLYNCTYARIEPFCYLVASAWAQLSVVCGVDWAAVEYPAGYLVRGILTDMRAHCIVLYERLTRGRPRQGGRICSSRNYLVLVAHDFNSAIGGQGQSGCTWTVCHGSSSELRISVRTKLNDVDTHS